MTTTQEILHCSKCGIQQVVRGGLRPECCPFCGALEEDGLIWFEQEDVPERGDDLREDMPQRYVA